MIQDSINQLLGTVAIGTKLASQGIQDAKGLKMEKLQGEKAQAITNMEEGRGFKEPKEYVAEVEKAQNKINKLGGSKFFPNTELQKQARMEQATTDKALTNYKSHLSYDIRNEQGLLSPAELEQQKLNLAEREVRQRLINGVNNRQAHKSFRQALREQSEQNLIGGNN